MTTSGSPVARASDDRLGDQPVVVGQQMVLQLEVEAIAEDARPRPGRLLGARPITGQQPARDLAMPAAGQAQQAVGVAPHELGGEARRALGAREMRRADQPAQAPIAGHVACDQDEVRAELAGPNAAQVLAPLLPVVRRSEAIRHRPDHPAPGRRLGQGRLLARLRLVGRQPMRPLPPATRDDQPGRVGHDRIEQVDLHPDDRPQAGLLRGRRETHCAVEALVIGQRDCRKTQLGGAFGQVVDGRGAVEEREIGVAVELGEGGGHSAIIERMF